MRDEHADASRQLRWLRAQGAVADLPPHAQALLGVMQLAVKDPRSGMESTRTRATVREEGEPPGELGGGLSADQRVELLYWRARALLDAGRPEDLALLLARTAPLLAESGAWRPRFAKLRAGDGQQRDSAAGARGLHLGPHLGPHLGSMRNTSPVSMTT